MTPAIDLLRKQAIQHTVHHYTHESSTESYGLEAARELGVESGRVFKTLVVQLDLKLLGVAILPVPSQLSLKAMAKACVAKRAEMADPALVRRSTGYVLGGVSPLAQKRLLTTVVDISAETLESMYISAGKRGLEIEIAPDDLVRMLSASYSALTAPKK